MTAGLGERLELFVQVCDAIQHAHQKGILHRDLRPSNVLAGRDGDRTILKVIDFGVARTTGPRADDRSFVTQVGRFIGTPEYMSPEQAGVAHTDVDTRADIYSLGVLLYELLAGVLPIDPERLRSASFAEIERVLFIEELPRPSRRATTPALARQLRGDLDWIVGRAMEKDRARRYQPFRIRRGHPPLPGPRAGRPGARSRLSPPNVRRNRAGVAAAALLIVIVAGFVIGLISNARTSGRCRRPASSASGRTRCRRSC